ncbi:magnesium/cobalt transporter CorA [Patescibacteria group bacterium]|nr:magnesium/cobalt transporter CorA [Patescibacteria group bacterium]MBU2260040.1 magnesium/cobalt transporter CorA [Patescibacteria group bacterium]
MNKLRIPSFLKTASKVGAAPGTLTHVGKKKVEKPHISMWMYNDEVCEEKTLTTVDDCAALLKNDRVNWVNVDGIHEVKVIESLGKQFNLHALLLEDILNTSHRPKLEEFEDCFFVVVKMLHYLKEEKQVSVEQVSIVLKENLVLSFQEQPQDVFNPMRERLRAKKGKIRSSGSDYLMYRLLDAIVDGYFEILVNFGDQIEELEKQLLSKPDDETLAAIHHLQRELVFVRKAILPMREVLAQLQHEEGDLITSKTAPYFRDVHDHIIQVMDAVDTYRDMASNMLSNYLSIVSNRMNEVMKVLTVIATIFIPLTFIAGVYGMNFQNMPELQWTWGYPAVWGLMMGVVLLMVVYFKRKGWW